MDHNTILITRTLNADDTARLREKLNDLWPGEHFTIIFGELLTAADLRRAWVGPQEYKEEDTDMTPPPRFVA